jgi:tRNA A-37 threonylcarbamoyl transferase component Bud32
VVGPADEPNPLQRSAVERLDATCGRFEAAWQQATAGGPRPRIEDYLGQASGPEREALLDELIALDIHYRRQFGDVPQAGEFRQRFPELGPEWLGRELTATALAKASALSGGDPADSYATLPPTPRPGVPAVEPKPAAPPSGADTSESYATQPPAAQPAEATVGHAGPAAPAASQPVPRAGRYALDEEIGGGGMGVVYRAHDPDLNRSLAVKILKKEHAGKPELERRFLEEAQVTGQLQHPGVPPIHELGRLDDGRPFFAMKLIKGRTLAELLKERSDVEQVPNLPGAEASWKLAPRWLTIFEHVCQVVAYAHGKGVVHRDLKPANVMVGAFGEVQVMDWGLAKLLTDNPAEQPASRLEAEGSVVAVRRWGSVERTRADSMLGTPSYMAPEQARGEVAKVDQRADVFGLGGILCVILTGQPPYTGRTAEAVFWLALGGELSPTHQRLRA